MNHPYVNLESKAHWRTAVTEHSPFSIKDLWAPKFEISSVTGIATAGSCFAQHFSRALIRRDYNWINEEPAPGGLPENRHADYHFGTFSFRTGNIYTCRMLWQWMEWATEASTIPRLYWTKDGRVYDPFRPGIEPNGFADTTEVDHSRAATLAAIRRALANADVFVFTMGLTEAWRHKESGVEFAICPGTVAGQFDTDQHQFVNASSADIKADLEAAICLMRGLNPELKFLITVSPVPLVATAGGEHVLTATMLSKSVLRTVAGEVSHSDDRIDYFPSYEVIAHPFFRGMFYGPDQRSVEPYGVDFVMKQFFDAQHSAYGATRTTRKRVAFQAAEELRCEEEILNAFVK